MDEQKLTNALRPFGWEPTPEFWDQYHHNPWVFNLTNALVGLSESNSALDRRIRDIEIAMDLELPPMENDPRTLMYPPDRSYRYQREVDPTEFQKKDEVQASKPSLENDRKDTDPGKT